WVYTGGVSRGVASVSVDREIAATTPASVGTPGGLMAATATATVHETSPVAVTKRSPWDRVDNWPPAETDAISITANLDGTNTENIRFEGTIDDVDGTALAPQINVSAVDNIYRLRRHLQIDPFASPMPVQSSSDAPGRARIVDP